MLLLYVNYLSIFIFQAQTKLILEFLMQHIYIISKNNIALEETFSQISYAIDTQKFTDLVEIVNQFVHLYSAQPLQIYYTIFMNKVGWCLIIIKINFLLNIINERRDRQE